MTLKGVKGQKLTIIFQNNYHFWEKAQKFLKQDFLAFVKNLIYWCIFFTLKMYGLWFWENRMSEKNLVL